MAIVASPLANKPRQGGAAWVPLTWALGLPLYPKRYLRFMAKSELFWFPLGLVVRACGAFKVRRGMADVEEAVAAVDAVAREPGRHSRAAREIAETYFDSDIVLTELLTDLGLT